ncbi:MAG: MBL fold metallo-hydrolase [Clostridiaceae bacterium]|nr:MBL fold metallo-hydrolase [Clostridiaceae bacterium]
MKITFLGATKTVTGSNFLVEAAGKNFLVDCGMYQGQAENEWENSAPFIFDVNKIDFMLLTHAHIDHSGRIPKLYNDGFRNKVYATKATCELCSIMLPDSGHIQEMEIEWKNRKRVRKGLEPEPPLYTAEDALKCMEIFSPIKYDEIIDIDEHIHVRFNDAGHMLGSAIIEVWVEENGKTTKAVFTGDIGNNDIPLLSSPTMIDDADYLVMESTYGRRLHIRNDEKAELFLNIVAETLDKGGTVVIPSFAVGRTQEILYELNNLKEVKKDEEFKKKYQTLMKAPVYVDSPLAISATEVFRNNMDIFDEETREIMKKGDNPLEFPGLQFTKTAEESKALNEKNESSIIISASGMCEVGRIKHHLKHNLWNPNSTILFVGYQAPGTLGRKIVDGAKIVKVFGEDIAINARIEYIEGYSGHADQEWLLNFIYSFLKKPKTIFLVHGEPEGQMILKQKIQGTAEIPVIIPEYGEEYELNEQVQRLGMKKGIKEYARKYIRLEVLDRIQTLKEELEDMSSIVQGEMLHEDAKEEDISKLNERIKELEQQIVKIVEGK